MAAREHLRRIAFVGCALLALGSWCGDACAATSPPYAGQSLAEVLEALRAQGLDLLYSSQLVHPGLRVVEEPAGRTPQAVLTEILAPHGLEARPIGGNRYVIVRTTATAPRGEAGASPQDAEPRTLDEVVVHASRYALRREETVAVTILDRQLLDAIPGVEQDAIRSLQRVPGTAASGLSAQSHVRGSYEDEVLIRYDGVRLYEPFHLKDFLNLFGAVDPELIDAVDAYSGGFPVEFGDRAGAVLDISARETHGAEHLIGASVFNNRLITSGSHANDRGRWLAGYRVSNLSAVLEQAGRQVGEPEFEDYLARYAYRITPELDATVGFLGLSDKHDIHTTDREQAANARYDDDATWLRLRYGPIDNRWSLMLHVSHSHLSAQRQGTSVREDVAEGSVLESRISTVDEYQLEGSYRLSQRFHWRAGLEYGRSNANYGYNIDATFEPPLADTFGRPSTVNRAFEGGFDGTTIGGWLSARSEIGRATAELGVRYDEREWLDRSGQFSPRASLRFDLNDATVLRLTAGRFLQSQAINELELEEALPAFAAPESSRHLIVGFERRLNSDLGLRVEAFDRETHGVRARFENTLDPRVLLPDLEVDRVRVAPQSSTVRGLEATLHNDPAASFSYWVSYSLSKTEDEFADGSQAQRGWDQRHAATAGLAWRNEHWLLGATLGYATGWPFTQVRFEGPPNNAQSGYTTAVLGPRNEERFDDRYWLDVRGEYTLGLPRGQLEFVAEVRNLLARGNDCCRDVEVVPQPGDTFVSETDLSAWYKLLPIVSINWRF